MIDYIARIAELLKNGEAVVFYTVGSDTFLNIKELKHRFGLLPSAVCDMDLKKQGRAWKGLEGVPVISPDEAMERFPEARWFVPSLNYRYQIMGFLTQERGIAPERIVNYEPVRKFRSCKYLNQSLFYDRTGELSFCCGVVCPRVDAGETPDVAPLRALRDRMLRAIEEDCIPKDSPCAGCGLIKEDYYPIEPRGLYFDYFCNSVCNYRCSYCNVAHMEKLGDGIGRHTMGELIGAFKQAGMLHPNYYVDFATAGEPTLYSGRKEIYRAFDGDRFVTLTNGYLYDPDLFSLMERKKSYLLVSIDAGTRETYRKIKGVDGFERVRENLKRYARAAMGIVALKYVFMPGINDVPEEIDGFIELCEETDSTFAVVSADFYSLSKITDRTGDMVKRLAAGVSEKGILGILHTANIPEEYAARIRSLMN